MLNEVCESTHKQKEAIKSIHDIYDMNKNASSFEFNNYQDVNQSGNNILESSTSPSSLSSCSSPTSSFSNKSTQPKFNDEKCLKKADSSTSNDQMSSIDDDTNTQENPNKNQNYLHHVDVGIFLKKISLSKCEFKFITNGYDHLHFMVGVSTK